MKINRGFDSSVENRARRVHDSNNQMPFQGAVMALVTGADGDSERVRISSIVGDQTGSFSYPFASQNAWVRGQPETTTAMVSIIAGDTRDLTPVGYYDPTKSGAAATYRSTAAAARENPTSEIPVGIQAYRSLSPGELDIASNFAQTFLGKGDVHSSRGGLSHFTMTSKEARLETPQFGVHGPHYRLTSNGALVDEIRYGTVRRAQTVQLEPDAPKSTPTQPSLIKIDATGTQPFAKEFSVLVDWLGDPAKLIDHRQGIVVEDDGTQATSAQTNKNLRARFRWFTTGDGETRAEVDEKGNTILTVSDQASEGYVMQVPAGDIKIKVGGQSNLGSGGGKFGLQASNDVQLNTEKKFAIVAEQDIAVKTNQRAEFNIKLGYTLKTDGRVLVQSKTPSGIVLGDKEKDKYPVLVANPDYISTLNDYYSAQSSLAGTLASYGGQAAGAWAAVGPLLMLLDPSGVVMGLCQSAGSAAGQVASSAPQVSSAVGKHLPRLARQPAGFQSNSTLAE